MHTLAIAGFSGDFLCFSDPYVQGPVTHTENLSHFIKYRADFICEAYQLRNEDFESLLMDDYQSLRHIKAYERVCIWSEHDSYNQLILSKLLHFLSDKQHRPKQVEMINITHYPGVKKFHSIGSLPPEAMRILWQQFKVVSEKQFSIGKQAWEALTATTPVFMAAFIQSQPAEMPVLAHAFRRHLQELPSTENGLSFIEQQTLHILADKGPMNAVKLFYFNNNHYEPLTYMGDLQYWHVLTHLAEAEKPAITIDNDERDKQKPHAPDRNHYNNRKHWHISLTPTSKALFQDNAHWLRMNTIKRWIGGTQIDTSTGRAWTIRRSDHSLVEISV